MAAMKVILFGATGMIGQGVLHECLRDPHVDRVLSIGRRTTGRVHQKLVELVHADLSDFSSVEAQLTGYDACCFCLGISSAGMTEADYHRITYDFTLAAARAVGRPNPGMTFIYVSGAGTDATERGRSMWARVKGKTENALLKLPFKAAYMFRPAYVQPLHGATSRTALYRALYAVMAPLYPLWKRVIPKYTTTTERIGRAVLHVARYGAPKSVLESSDIDALGSA
jgi:uncharacterized protein YbjT (DUF2867 family)